MKRIYLFFAIVLPMICTQSCNNAEKSAADSSKKAENYAKITFVELGSVNCIPCKAMQPVMKAIEERYGDQIKVIFYDVWQPDQKKYAE